jgi:hypothetical protein
MQPVNAAYFLAYSLSVRVRSCGAAHPVNAADQYRVLMALDQSCLRRPDYLRILTVTLIN